MGATADSMTLLMLFGVVVVCTTSAACTIAGGGPGNASGATSGGSGNPPTADAGATGDGSAEASEGELGDATLGDVVFVPGLAGPRVLVRGTDPKKRIEWLRVRFLDENGAPAHFDLDGDGSFEADVIDVGGSALDRGESGFFFELQAAPRVDEFVKAVSVEIDDGRVPALAPKTAVLAPLPMRGPGETCDPQGFDRCSGVQGAEVCSGSRCTSAELARMQSCSSAPMIVPTEAPLVVGGKVRPGASLFEPMSGCTNGMRNDRPEAVFRLFVDRAYSELVLTTQSNGTTLDTVVSVLDSCGPSARVLACNDDDPPPYSTVVLTDATPGTYVVVVDSLSRTGGAFELRVTAR